MKSMTGYAYREASTENYNLSVEIKGYNNRYLEVYINQPPFFSALEGRIREAISSRCKRGKIEASIRLREINTDVKVSVDTLAAKAYHEALNTLSRDLALKEPVTLSHIMGMEAVVQIEKVRDTEAYWPVLQTVLSDALEAFDAERVREGAAAEKDIMSHLESISASVSLVAGYAPELEKSIQDNLRKRFEELLGNQVDENRILSETAVLLMKYTISEEISRLGAHLDEFRAESKRNAAPGKKLDFLCQEINREINTIGSKSPILEVSRAVVSMKDALENIREQLRNVE